MHWKGLGLKTLREQLGTGFDELIEAYEIELRLLVLGGIGRCFTLAQAVRFLTGVAPATVSRLLESMSNYNRLLVKYDLAGTEGRGEKRNSYVYAVSEGGVGRLSRVEPELLERLDFGRLKSHERRRIHHALGVTQVIVNLRDQYKIVDIIPEKMMRAELRRENNHRLIRQQERLIFKGLGDLLVELQRVGEAKSFWQEIEISHKNTSKDLRGKDKNLHFYCLTENQKNKVARYTGAASYVLGDPFLVEAFQSGELAPSKYEGHDQETELSEAHQSVHEAIERLGGMATIGVLSALLGKARSTVNESLLKLFRTRFVRQADVCLKPGWNSGRPNALYLTGIDGNVEVEELRRGLSRSLITQFLVSYNRHQFAGYDSKSGILTTVAAEGMVAKYHLFFDDQRLSVEELLEKTLALEQQFRGTEKVNFRLILHNEKRYSAVEAELRRAKSQVQAVNIFTVMEQVNRLTKQKREAKRKIIPAKASALPT